MKIKVSELEKVILFCKKNDVDFVELFSSYSRSLFIKALNFNEELLVSFDHEGDMIDSTLSKKIIL